MAGAITDMSIEWQIGQLFMVGFWGTEPSRDILQLIVERHVGGVILFSRNIRSAQQTRDLTDALQAAARAAGHPVPLLIATDQENGLVRRLGPDSTAFPGNMALGATGSEELTASVATATGHELLALGINMNLAPVVDVNNNPANPVIGIRSFGENPELVARLGAAAVRGYQQAGVVATLKHFPGHGDTSVDSHLALPSLPYTSERLDAVELVPFRRGIAAGAEAIMTAHLHLPTLVPSGETLPATLSPSIVRGLLRERLGYDGMIMTDCLEMDAVAATVGVARGAVLGLDAGNDLILVSHRADRQHAALDAVRDAVEGGELPAADITSGAVERVLRLKRRRLSWDGAVNRPDLAVVGNPAHRSLARDAYAASTTLIRDTAGVTPLRLAADARLLVVVLPASTMSKAVDIAYDDGALRASIRRFHDNIQVAQIPAGATPEMIYAAAGAAARADAVLLVTMNAHADTVQQRVAGRIVAAVRSGVPIIGLAACDPYDAAALPLVGAYLASYDYTPPALAAAVDVLFGHAEARGHLPVSLPATN